jgi:hypothetical protein
LESQQQPLPSQQAHFAVLVLRSTTSRMQGAGEIWQAKGTPKTTENGGGQGPSHLIAGQKGHVAAMVSHHRQESARQPSSAAPQSKHFSKEGQSASQHLSAHSSRAWQHRLCDARAGLADGALLSSARTTPAKGSSRTQATGQQHFRNMGLASVDSDAARTRGGTIAKGGGAVSAVSRRDIYPTSHRRTVLS